MYTFMFIKSSVLEMLLAKLIINFIFFSKIKMSKIVDGYFTKILL